YASGRPRDLHSFPTRRSSDLPGTTPWGGPRFTSGTAEALTGHLARTSPTCADRAGSFNAMTARDLPGPSVPQPGGAPGPAPGARSEEHTSELQSRENLVCRLL